MNDDPLAGADRPDAPPVPAEPLAPPPLAETAPAPAVGPWGFWPSVGLMFGLILGLLGAQVVAVVAVVAIRLGQGQKLDPESLPTDGLLLSLSMFLSTPVGLGLSWLFIRLRRGPGLREYLALRRFGWQDAVLGLFGLAVLWGLSSWINPEPSVWMVKTYRNPGPSVPFYCAVILLAPVVEEVIFRGFAFAGLVRGRGGVWAAIGITTLAWGALHVQYGWRELLFVVGLGGWLGWLRARSGSLWLPLALHAVNNLGSTLVLKWFLSPPQ